MGFLKFLKREKKESLDELDLPPAPPPLEGAEPDFGASGFDEKMPELPEFPEFDEKISAPEDMPKFDFPEDRGIAEKNKEIVPKFPDFPEMEETEEYSPPGTAPVQPVMVPATQPALSIPQEKEPEHSPEEERRLSSYYPKMSGRLFAHERRSLRERPNVKTIYIRIDNFKATLGSINIVRSDLRKSEEALNKLETIKNSKDRSFDKVKVSIDDLQRKLIFIDKTLFKGE